MDLSEGMGNYLPEESLDRIKRHIGLLIRAHHRLRDRNIDREHEQDIEEFTGLLLAFSRALGSHLRRPILDQTDCYDATLEELQFYEMGFNQLNRK